MRQEKNILSTNQNSTEAELITLIETLPEELSIKLRAIIDTHKKDLVSEFYSRLLDNSEAAPFLSHQIVHDRLQHALKKWIVGLFDVEAESIQDLIKAQREIGAIHARIQVPIHVVMQGARIIKNRIDDYLQELELPPADVMLMMSYAHNLIDLAIGVMSQAFVKDTQMGAQVDQAYRAFVLGQDVSLERETQRAALMDWSQSVLFALYGAATDRPLPSLGQSGFGLWLLHKAPIIFWKLPELEKLRGAVEHMDSVQLNVLASARTNEGPGLPVALEAFQAALNEIKFLLSEMFQTAASLETGRDPLTRTLNRRFMASILTREITIANTTGVGLSVMLIDLDRFKDINDRYGHGAGDLVLQKIAEAILANSRQSDFVFRYGGEEFLIVLVEADNRCAVSLAEQMRIAIGSQQIRLPDGSSTLVTASIGVATFNGHPDYRYLVEAADKALYSAKEKGRNRCESADLAEHDNAR